jgi:hypothetical protein
MTYKSLTAARLMRAREAMAKGKKLRPAGRITMLVTERQWADLGGRPDIWAALPRVEGTPHLRYASNEAAR